MKVSIFHHLTEDEKQLKVPTLFLRVLLFIILVLLTVYGNYRFRLYLLRIREQEQKLGRNNSTASVKENRVSNRSQNIDEREFRTIKKTERLKNKEEENKEENKKKFGEKRKSSPHDKPQSVLDETQSFSFYLPRDKKLEKGAKLEVFPYSQASFSHNGNINIHEGRFYSEKGGLFMVSAMFHVKTELLVIPGHKKKLKKKSFKGVKIQLKLQICVNNKCKSTSEIRSVQALNNFKQIKTTRSSIGSISILSGQGVVQTCSCGGLVHVEAGQHVSVHVQVTGPVHILAGSAFSGIEVP